MRMIVYAVSAACGCAPVGYNYYQRSYYQPAAYVEPAPVGCPYNPCGYERSASEWGGETALPTGYSYGYQPYYSPYYVGSAYNSYGYPYHHRRVRVGVEVEARNHHHPVPTTAIALAKPKTKVASSVPVPKPDPRKGKKVASHHFPWPAKMVAVETQD